MTRHVVWNENFVNDITFTALVLDVVQCSHQFPNLIVVVLFDLKYLVVFGRRLSILDATKGVVATTSPSSYKLLDFFCAPRYVRIKESLVVNCNLISANVCNGT